jgi:hypothetical protein
MSEMTNPSAQSASNEHESVNEKPYRLLVAEGLSFAENTLERAFSARIKAEEAHNSYMKEYAENRRMYWLGVTNGIRAARGEIGARVLMNALIENTKWEKKYYDDMKV